MENNYYGSVTYVIHISDVGKYAYHEGYVRWLEQQLQAITRKLRDESERKSH